MRLRRVGEEKKGQDDATNLPPDQYKAKHSSMIEEELSSIQCNADTNSMRRPTSKNIPTTCDFWVPPGRATSSQATGTFSS